MTGKKRLSALFLAACFVLAALDAGHAERLFPVQGPGVREACAADYRQFCWGIPPGGGRIVLCLNANADRLSQQCFQALTGRGLVYAGVLKACQFDYQQFCAGVPPGFGRGLQCLLGSAPALSPPCRDALQGHELLGPGTEGQEWDK